MNYNNFFNLQDTFYKVILKTDKNTYLKQGILYRDSDSLGLIIPKFRGFDDEILHMITLYSELLNEELEFNYDSDYGIIYGESLMFIPLNELKINVNQIVHKKNVYPRSLLSKLNYCLKVHFSENYNEAMVNTFSIYSYFILKENALIGNEDISVPKLYRYSEEEGVYYHTLVSVLDIDRYVGSPCLCVSKNEKGEITQTIIYGIIVDASDDLYDDKIHNTGIMIRVAGILDFINSF